MAILSPKDTVTDKNQIFRAMSVRPKRICFNSCHRNALKLDEKYYSKLTLPFSDTISPIFFYETLIQLLDSKFNNGIWLPTNDAIIHDSVENFIDKYRQEVFIRDGLSMSIALSENYCHEDRSKRTEIGELECLAKYSSVSSTRAQSALKLAKILASKIKQYPFYNKAKYICSIPTSKPGQTGLMTWIANKIALGLGLIDFSPYLSWQKAKPGLKNIAFSEKWNILEKTELVASNPPPKDAIILIDDLYQSGITMQFVARFLINSGAKYVYGLSIVKGSDHDNVKT